MKQRLSLLLSLSFLTLSQDIFLNPATAQVTPDGTTNTRVDVSGNDFTINQGDSLLAFLPVFASAKSYDDKKIGIEFPNQIGSFEFRNYYKYDNEELGYSIGYGSLKAQITLYIFDGGISEIQNGIGDRWVSLFCAQALEDVFTLERNGLYRFVVETPINELLFSKEVLEYFISKSLHYEINQGEIGYRPVTSYIFCRGVNSKMLKIRATGRKSVVFERELDEFLIDLKKLIESSNKALEAGLLLKS